MGEVKTKFIDSGGKFMRRSDREIVDFDEIVAVLERCDTVRVGINGGEYPYVLPLSFGYEVSSGKVTIYVHGAKAGLKHELLARDAHICVEADICHGFKATEHGVTCEYESVIAFGRARPIADPAEARRALTKIIAHCGFNAYKLPEGAEATVAMYALELETLTGKRRFVK